MNHEFRGAVLVAKNNKVIFNKAYGGIPTDSTTAFWIGSITKHFTASAILKLQEQNRLSISDSISKFIDNVPIDKSGITIHHLLTHSSGIANNYTVYGIINRQDAIDIILSAPLEYEIGERFNYSAEGYNLLAIIVELITSGTFEKYISQNIINESNLSKTDFWGIGEDSKSLASYKNSELMKSLSTAVYAEDNSVSNYGFKGSTGISSTTTDLFSWILSLMSNRVINQKSLEQMFKPYALVRGDSINGTFYGYGWFIEYKEGEIWETRHSGAEDGGIGHNGIIRFYDNDDAIIVLSNAGVFNGEGRLNGVEWSTVLSFGIRDVLRDKK